MAKAPRPKGIPDEALKLFAGDLEAYSKTLLKIRTKQAEVKTFRFNNAQRIVHDKLKEQYQKEGRIRAIILKARQEGVSTYTAARFFRKVHLWPNQEALIIADELERAKKLFAIYDRFYYLLPEEIQPTTRYVSKQTQMVFDNPDDKTRGRWSWGSMVSVETAKDEAAGRATTPTLVHASEMAFWPNGEDVWVALRSAVPDMNSEIIIESTANGVGNFFHQFWLDAEEGNNGYLAIFLPWWIHEEYRRPLDKKARAYVKETLDDIEQGYVHEGILFQGKRHKLTLEQIAWRRQTIREMQGNERAFRQEYPATPSEAFLVSGNCFFDEEILSKYDQAAKPPSRHNLVRKSGGILLPKAQHGYVRVWMKPSQKREGDREPLYVIAADTASGRQVSAEKSTFSDPNNERGGRDFSSADILDVRNRRQVCQIHGRMAPEIFADLLMLAGYFYSASRRDGTRDPALIAVERNHSSGETVLRLLKEKYRYPRLYYSRLINRRMNKVQQTLGWSTNVETRQPMLDNLAQAIREETIEIPNKDTIKEMFTFVRGEDGKPAGQEGTHDDRVISLAIALFVGEQVNFETPKNYRQTELVGTASSSTGLFDY